MSAFRRFRRATAAVTVWLAVCVVAGWAAWTPPRTWVTSELVTASLLNQHLRDNLLYLKDQLDDTTVRVYVDTTSRSNGTTVETDLGSYAVPAADTTTSPPGGLYEDGQAFYLKAFGTFANTVNTKTYRLYVGTGAGGVTTTLDATATAGVDPWVVEATVRRVGSASEKIFIRFTKQAGAGTDKIFYATATVDLTAAWTLKLTGQSSAASNDITQQDFAVYKQ